MKRPPDEGGVFALSHRDHGNCALVVETLSNCRVSITPKAEPFLLRPQEVTTIWPDAVESPFTSSAGSLGSDFAVKFGSEIFVG